jgi:cell shape-determining protein MreC
MSFGFKHPGDGMNKSKTGFEGSQNISYISQLEKEMEENNESTLNEVEVLKQENEFLKKELEELKSAGKTS